MNEKKFLIDRTQQTKPRRFFKPREAQCYKCSMPGLYHCQFPGCTLPMCLKHRITKGGGTLCDRHKFAQLVQEEAAPSTRFRSSGDAVPHEEKSDGGNDK